MTSEFSWQNSISLCPASFRIPRPNLPVTPGFSWLRTFVFQSPIMKRHLFGVLVLKGMFPLLSLDLICSSFSHSLRWMFRSLILDFSSFLLIIYSALYISNFDKLCLHFHLSQKDKVTGTAWWLTPDLALYYNKTVWNTEEKVEKKYTNNHVFASISNLQPSPQVQIYKFQFL